MAIDLNKYYKPKQKATSDWYAPENLQGRMDWWQQGLQRTAGQPTGVKHKYYKLRAQNELTDTPEGLKAYAKSLGIEIPEQKKGVNFLTRAGNLLRTLEGTHALRQALRGKSFSDEYLKSIKKRWEAVKSGEEPEKLYEGEDILEDVGVKNKWVKKIGGTALDILADPTTYLTLGAGAGTKIAGVQLSKAGTKALAKFAEKIGEKAAREGFEQAFKKAPAEFVKKYGEQGGLKWAGQTIIPGTTYKNVIKYEKAKEAGVPFRGTLGWETKEKIRGAKPVEAVAKMFKRDYRPSGVLPHQWEQLKEIVQSGYLDKLVFKGSDVDEKVYKLFKGTSKPERVSMYKAIMSGDYSKLSSKSATIAKSASDIFENQIAKLEMAKGILPKVRKNYVTQIYKNPERAERFLEYGAQLPTQNTKFAQARAIENVLDIPSYVVSGKTGKRIKFDADEAWNILTGASGISKSGVDYGQARKMIEEVGLMPELDLAKVLQTRWKSSTKATTGREVREELAQKFGQYPQVKKELGIVDAGASNKAKQIEEGMNKLKEVSDDILKQRKALESKIKNLKSRVGKRTIEGEAKAFGKTFKGLPKQEKLAEYKEQLEALTSKYTSVKDARKVLYDRVKDLKKQVGPRSSITPWGNLQNFKVGDEDFMLPDFVIDYLKRIENSKLLTSADVREAARWFDKTQNAYKSLLTSWFPAFHVRNEVSNVAQSFLDIYLHAINPAEHARAIAIMGKANGSITTKLGTKISFNELRQLAKRHGITMSGWYEGELITGLSDYAKVIKKFNIGRKAGTAVENEARLLHFVASLERGLSPAEAAARTKQFLFDYSNLTDFEKRWMRRFVPFYTWTRKNLSLQMKMLMTKPGVVGAEYKIASGMGEPLSEEDKQNLPSYLANKILMKATGKDKYGRPIVYAGLGLPIEEFSEWFDQGGGRGILDSTLRKFFGMLTPLIKIPTEKVTGQDIFRATDIEDIVYAEELSWLEKYPSIAKWLDLRKKTGTEWAEGEVVKKRDTWTADPWKLWLLRSLPTTRFQSTLGYLTSPSMSDKEKRLKLFTGIKPYPVDIEQTKYYKEKAEAQLLVDLLKRYGYLGTSETGSPYLRQPEGGSPNIYNLTESVVNQQRPQVENTRKYQKYYR